MMKRLLNLNFESFAERKVYRLHMLYSIIDGIILGVLALNEFVFLKSLKGTSFQVGFLFQFSVIVLVSSVALNEFVNRTKDKKKMIRILALATRLPLMLIAFFPSDNNLMYGNTMCHWVFLSVFFIYFSANPIIYPVINQMLRKSYSRENFGRYYSHAASANKFVMMIVTFAYGLLLDNYLNSYLFVFPIISLLGILAFFVLTKIPFSFEDISISNNSWYQSVKDSIKQMNFTLRTNKAFKDFEMGFMFYGFAFMGTVGVIAIYFDRALELNYSSVAFYKNSYNLIAIVLLPFLGKLIGRIDPRTFSMVTYLGLAGYVLFIGLTDFFPIYVEFWGIKLYFTLLIAVLSNGFFAATMALLWYIGSAYFCKPEEAADYQSIHLTLTGLRSFFAPLIGIVLYEWFGFFTTFMIGFAMLFIAVGINFWSLKLKR